jgi:hypothetical protein
MFKINSLVALLLFLLSTSVFSAPPPGKHFDHAIFVVFENTNYVSAMKQSFLSQLSARGASFSNLLAITHPSQGNYIAMTSGSINAVKNDNPVNLDMQNITDLLEAKGLTWKVYAEAYPGNCFTGAKTSTYVRKHNPFISYLNIQKNSARCANIVNADQFDRDAANGNLANYIFYIPDMNNDGHNTDVTYADKWYSQKFSKYVNDPQFMQNTILVSTFDESGSSSSTNQIYTSIVGTSIKPIVISAPLASVSFLTLLEDNWSLGNLGQMDATTASIPDIW